MTKYTEIHIHADELRKLLSLPESIEVTSIDMGFRQVFRIVIRDPDNVFDTGEYGEYEWRRTEPNIPFDEVWQRTPLQRGQTRGSDVSTVPTFWPQEGF